MVGKFDRGRRSRRGATSRGGGRGDHQLPAVVELLSDLRAGGPRGADLGRRLEGPGRLVFDLGTDGHQAGDEAVHREQSDDNAQQLYRQPLVHQSGQLPRRSRVEKTCGGHRQTRAVGRTRRHCVRRLRPGLVCHPRATGHRLLGAEPGARAFEVAEAVPGEIRRAPMHVERKQAGRKGHGGVGGSVVLGARVLAGRFCFG
mmetsp:Transcript_14578/g.29537  ORF Transcript_14578/g.29537 Transcript_14578/m.29537 type:complete len:201 (-) Transcript_14578:2050-2652(-)